MSTVRPLFTGVGTMSDLWIQSAEETLPTEDEAEQAERELYFEHCVDTVAEEISSEAEQLLLLI
jgi:hypothetical protein